jgi:hypothetical protein
VHWLDGFETGHQVCEHGHATVGVKLNGVDGSVYECLLAVADARVLAEYISDSAEQATSELMGTAEAAA